ncbi:unnamed protein product [Cyprideis torosa]|uniref:Uncharacterized protein n=1 Tax=Cyprideis torosa TaxID=163714 RepID=A0A7R8ZIB2_9CRUS|nr:unnamed protein product [Cyprideis torosa]CAG0884401.1 unnamed protein product [Cyprideis torosa]
MLGASSVGKSPKATPPRKEEKEESFWEKIGTLGRKKKNREVIEVEEDGKVAIDGTEVPFSLTTNPEDFELDEGEERSMVEPKSLDDYKVRGLTGALIHWINDELSGLRIIVKDLEEDLYDGQILQRLLEKLGDFKLGCPEVTQSEEGQLQKLCLVVSAANHILGIPRHQESPHWDVDKIHSKSLVAILHLLVALARHFRAPVRFPENVIVNVVVVKKENGVLSHRVEREQLTKSYAEWGMRAERDAFDTLFDHAPEKLAVVQRTLLAFVNRHLSRINVEVQNMGSEFQDGVNLILLMGLLEGYFTPLYCFNPTPREFEQRVQNVQLAFDLMVDAGLPNPKSRPEDIVNADLKSTLRVLYNLFDKYKGIS